MVDNTIHRTVENTKPLLIATASLGAAAFLLGMFKIARRRPRREAWLLPRAVPAPKQPTLLGTIARSVLASAAASLAGHIMQRLQRSLEARMGLEPAPGTAASSTAGAVGAAAGVGMSDATTR